MMRSSGTDGFSRNFRLPVVEMPAYCMDYPGASKTMRSHVFTAVLALIALAGFAAGDEVYLTDGRVIEGTVTPVENGGGAVNVRVGSGGMVVVQHFSADQVEKVVYGRSARQNKIDAIVKAKEALTEDSEADECWNLAEQAREAGDQALFRELALETLARDRENEDARKALGLTTVRGICMRPNEAAVASGLVSFNGHWMTWSEREENLRLQAKREETAAAQRQEIEDRRAARAAAQAAYDSLVDPYASFDIPSSRPAYNAPRVIYWGVPAYVPVHGHGVTNSGFSVKAKGGNKHTQWSFSWGG